MTWYQSTIPIDIKINVFLWIDFNGSQYFPVERSLPEVCSNIDLSFTQDIKFFFSLSLNQHLIRWIDLPDELISNSILKVFGPVAKEKDTSLDYLKLIVTRNFCIVRKVPCLRSSPNLFMKESSSSTLNVLFAIWLLMTNEVIFSERSWGRL